MATILKSETITSPFTLHTLIITCNCLQYLVRGCMNKQTAHNPSHVPDHFPLFQFPKESFEWKIGTACEANTNPPLPKESNTVGMNTMN